MSTLTTLDLVRRASFFEHLSEEQALALLGELEKRSFKRSENLVVAGQKSDVMYVILSGTANVTICHNQDRRLVLATLGPGDCIGEMSLLDNQPHSATVIATKDVDALMLTREGFNGCVQASPKMAMAVMRGLVGRLRKADQKILSLAMFNVFDRVARYLFEIADDQNQGQLVIKKKLSHAAIAREVGASREMVSRAMKGFESSAFIMKTESGSLLLTERRTKLRV